MITGYDHVQLAIPAGSEDLARAFYGGLLGMTELSKPPVLARRGGCWFTSGDAVLHLGVEDPFVAAANVGQRRLQGRHVEIAGELERERHGVRRALAGLLEGQGYPVTWSNGEIPGVRRFHTTDPFGNRLEFQAV